MADSMSLHRWSRRAAKGRFAAVAAVVTPRILRALRADGLKETLETIEEDGDAATRWARRVAGELPPEEARGAIAWMFRHAPHVQGACLEQSVVQYALQGPSVVRFVVGVQRNGEKARVEAHAWVETDTTPHHGAGFDPILTREPRRRA